MLRIWYNERSLLVVLGGAGCVATLIIHRLIDRRFALLASFSCVSVCACVCLVVCVCVWCVALQISLEQARVLDLVYNLRLLVGAWLRLHHIQFATLASLRQSPPEQQQQQQQEQCQE